MEKLRLRDERHRQQVQDVRIAVTLMDGPKTLDEIVRGSYRYLQVLGLFKMSERQARDRVTSVKNRLEELLEREWVVLQGEQYALTLLGREEANKRMSQLGETGDLVRKFFEPQTASKVTLGIHLTLAAFKLPAALISGSVGLLNDAIDTLLDGLSSLLVYFGIRFQKEKFVNIILVALMVVTGVLTFYEAVRRFFVPLEPEVDWFTFLAAILSAVVCFGLWTYQRYIGLHSGILALITQSVDSRNHVIVAVSVTAGLVASLLRFSLLDTLVGLCVALLILKSAIELVIETIHSFGEEEIDLSHYKFWIDIEFGKFRQAHLRDWMLYLVGKRGINTRDELVALASQALDFNQVPAMRALAIAQSQSQGQSQGSSPVDMSMNELFERGWLTENEPLHITEAGRKRLNKFM